APSSPGSRWHALPERGGTAVLWASSVAFGKTETRRTTIRGVTMRTIVFLSGAVLLAVALLTGCAERGEPTTAKNPAALAGGTPKFSLLESGQVRPLAPSPDGSRVFAVNTPAARLEIFDVNGGDLEYITSVPVGLEPVAVAARTNTEVWV